MRRRPLGVDTITVLRAPIIADDHGNDKRDWAHASSTIIDGCDAQPQGSQETLVNEDQTLIAYLVLAPPGSDVRSTDRVELNGRTFEVYGVPGVWTSRSGRLDYVEIRLTDWRGGA